MGIHPHVHSNNTAKSHYFQEFLMLFLAITASFFVENLREHYVERHREKQFMESMIMDLRSDITILDMQLTEENNLILGMDSLIFFLTRKDTSLQPGRLYYLGRMATRHDIFNYNNRTIDQMRNSGGFRLVHETKVANEIMDYYRQITLLEMLEAIEKREEDEYRQIAIRLFEPDIFNLMVTPGDAVIVPAGAPLLRSNDPALMKDAAGVLNYLKSSMRGTILIKIRLKNSARELIEMIMKEYNLD